MNLYLISQTDNATYDSYRSAVVAAKSEAAARLVHPDGSGRKLTDDREASWVTDPKLVAATWVGVAKPGTESGTVVCADFCGERQLAAAET